MNRKTRIKSDAVAHWVPRDRDEVNTAIAELGNKQRDRARIQADMNDALAVCKAEFDGTAKPIGERCSELAKGLQLWCEANRATLTRDGKVKFHEFATGTVKWRMRPPSIAVRGVEAVLGTLKQLGLDRFVRTKQEVDKDALLKEPEIAKGIGGITVSQREDFVVVPHESNIEEVP